MNSNIVIYFERIEVEHIPREFKIFIGNKNIKTNINRMNAYNSIMCGCFFGFIDFMLNTKSLPAYTNLSFPEKYEMNDKIILKTFSVTKKIKIKRYHKFIFP